MLQRLAPSQANVERLSELIAANERDERCELMWGSPGTILVGRELGLDVSASVEWLHGRRDSDGLWTQQLSGHSRRFLGPAHGFAGCVLALGDVTDVSETLQRFAFEEDGLVNWPGLAGMELGANRDGQIRMHWCHGAPGIVATLAHKLDEQLAVAGGELTWRAGPLRKGANLCHGTHAGSHERARSPCTPRLRWSATGRSTVKAHTRSGPETPAQRCTSRTASTVEGSYPSPRHVFMIGRWFPRPRWSRPSTDLPLAGKGGSY